MRRDEHHAGLLGNPSELRLLKPRPASNSLEEGVDDRVTRHRDRIARHPLVLQTVRRGGRRCEVQIRQGGDHAAVHLLRIGREAIIRAQTRLQMDDGHAFVERGQSAGERRRGVALDDDRVEALVADRPADLGDRVAGDICEGTGARLQVYVDADSEAREQIRDHPAVLAGGDDHGPHPLAHAQLADQRGELDGLGAGADHDAHAHGRRREC
jgi:hypothetical protein